MKNSEDLHKNTELIYRGLTENFNPGVKHVLACGKAYYKSLQGVTASARAFTDALLKVGATSRSTCRGGTEDIGEAIFQISEINKDIQARVEENTKALFTELILPLEQKLEGEFRRVYSQHRKYMQDHKTVAAPYAKAYESLRKFRKKTKNKLVYDEQKEANYLKALQRSQERLDDFRANSLRTALLEERKSHCFLLEKLTNIAIMQAAHHRQASESLSMGLTTWRNLSSKPNVLPQEADRLFLGNETPEEIGNGSIYRMGNGVQHISDETRSLGSPYRRSMSARDGPRQLPSYGSEYNTTRTLPSSRGISVPPPPPPGSSQVRAIYTMAAESDNKLSFTEGDVINLIGDGAEGWQYGFNNRSGKYGWFPASFTEALPGMREQMALHSRVKSMGDLNMIPDSNQGFHMENNIPGAYRRPKSLYEGSGEHLHHNPPSSLEWNGTGTGNYMSDHHTTYYSLPRQVPDYNKVVSYEHDPYQSTLPIDFQLQKKS